MAILRGFLGSKGRFVGVLGLPPQKEMPIIEPSPDYGVHDIQFCRLQVGNGFIDVIHMEEC